MGYELNKLMQQFGVSSPVLPYSGGIAAEDQPKYDAYKQQYQQRIQDTPIYATPPNAQMTQRQTPPPPPQQPGQPAPPPQPLPARQAAVAPGGMGLDNMNQTIKDWYRANPGASNDQVKALQSQYGVTNQDLYGATGNYWGNTLTPPQFKAAPPPVAPVTTPTVAPVADPGKTVFGPGGSEGLTYEQYDYLKNRYRYEGPDGTGDDGSGASGAVGGPGGDASGNGSGDGYNQGGLIKTHFDDGGWNDLSSRYQDDSQDAPGYTAPHGIADAMAAPTQSQYRPAGQKPSMEDLISRYTNAPSAYGEELKTARETSRANQKAFQDMLEKQIAGQTDAGPSKSEMYFRLAAALGAPTRSGHFGEAMGNAAAAMADYQKDVRESQRKGEANKMALGMEGQKLKMAGDKEDLNTVRGLAGEEAKGQREQAGKLLADYLRSGQPQSEAGKNAVDAGLKPGTPEFNAYVQKQVQDKIDSGTMFKNAMLMVAQSNAATAQGGLALRQDVAANNQAQQHKLTPQEMKLKQETELALTTMADAYTDLKRVRELNPNTFDGSVIDTAQRKALEAIGSKDPKVVNTNELDNILRQGALSTAATTLKTQISDADIKMLQGLQGIGAKSIEERDRIAAAAQRRLLNTYRIKKLQLQKIDAGAYRTTQPEPMPGAEE